MRILLTPGKSFLCYSFQEQLEGSNYPDVAMYYIKIPCLYFCKNGKELTL